MLQLQDKGAMDDLKQQDKGATHISTLGGKWFHAYGNDTRYK